MTCYQKTKRIIWLILLLVFVYKINNNLGDLGSNINLISNLKTPAVSVFPLSEGTLTEKRLNAKFSATQNEYEKAKDLLQVELTNAETHEDLLNIKLISWQLALAIEDEWIVQEELSITDYILLREDPTYFPFQILETAQVYNSGGFSAEDFYQIGWQDHKSGLYEEALIWYDRALRLDTNHPYALFRMVQVLSILEEWVAIEGYSVRAYNAGVKRSDLAYFHGRSLVEQERWIEAINVLQRSLDSFESQDCGKSNFYFWIAFSHENKNTRINSIQSSQAISAYLMALKLDDFSVYQWQKETSHIRLARIYIRINEIEKAIDQLKLVLELEPNQDEAISLLESLS